MATYAQTEFAMELTSKVGIEAFSYAYVVATQGEFADQFASLKVLEKIEQAYDYGEGPAYVRDKIQELRSYEASALIDALKNIN